MITSYKKPVYVSTIFEYAGIAATKPIGGKAVALTQLAGILGLGLNSSDLYNAFFQGII